MTKKLEYCFIPVSDDGLSYRCLLCDYTSLISAGYVGYCNHIKYKHAKKEMPNEIDVFLKKYFEMAIRIIENNIPIEQKTKTTGKCKYCQDPTEFRSIAAGYKVFCSHICSANDAEVSKNRLEKTKAALLEKYGVENASQIKDVPKKVKNTKKVRYGDENYVNRNKAIETSLQKYGFANYTQTKEYKERVKEISLSKYGVEHFTQSEEVKDKINKTNLEKYGVRWSLQNKSVREKGYETLIKNGGFTLQRGSIEERAAYLAHKEAYRKRVLEYAENGGFKNVKLLDAYSMKFICLVCNGEFFANSDSALTKGNAQKYPRCFKCFPVTRNKYSLFHQEFVSFLVNSCGLSVTDFIQNDRAVLKDINKEIDVYIPGKNIGFELNGNFWHTEKHGRKERRYHINKTEICEKNNIHLIQIFEDEWENKRDLVCSKVMHYMGTQKQTRKSIYARDCLVKEINSSLTGKFLDEYHIQGKEMSASIHLGAYSGTDLIAVMTFGKPRLNMNRGGKNRSESSVELIRFATKTDVRIPGIASKAFSYFVKKLKTDIDEIYSYADRRWTYSKRNVYLELGFKETNRSDPNYFYVSPKESFLLRKNRFSYRKSQIAKKFPNSYNSTLTEVENMRALGYDRIWDCGTIRYTWTRT